MRRRRASRRACGSSCATRPAALDRSASRAEATAKCRWSCCSGAAGGRGRDRLPGQFAVYGPDRRGAEGGARRRRRGACLSGRETSGRRPNPFGLGARDQQSGVLGKQIALRDEVAPPPRTPRDKPRVDSAPRSKGADRPPQDARPRRGEGDEAPLQVAQAVLEAILAAEDSSPCRSRSAPVRKTDRIPARSLPSASTCISRMP